MTDRRPVRTALAALAAILAGPALVRGQAAGVPQFEKDVLPVLSARCLKCHGAGKPKAGLDLRTRAGLLKGGESGPALVPGSAATSLVFEMVRKGEMPPKGDKLTPTQVALFKGWIDGGAPAGQADLAGTRPGAYERQVERLLASPHYGERWGRHWLDAAGYADSVGGDNDPGQVFPREGMYRYRDYVVRALNEDRPFDRFLTEQLAGDELEDWRTAPTLEPAMRE